MFSFERFHYRIDRVLPTHKLFIECIMDHDSILHFSMYAVSQVLLLDTQLILLYYSVPMTALHFQIQNVPVCASYVSDSAICGHAMSLNSIDQISLSDTRLAIFSIMNYQ